MPTYEELEAFVQDIADSSNVVLSAKASKLLGIEPDPFEPSKIEHLPYFARHNPEDNYTEDEFQAMAITYGAEPIEYIIKHVNENGFPEGWHEFIIPLSVLEHLETSDMRRKFFQEQLMQVDDNRLAYRLLNALSYVGGDSNDMLKAFIEKWKNRVGTNGMSISILEQAQQMIDFAEKRKSISLSQDTPS